MTQEQLERALKIAIDTLKQTVQGFDETFERENSGHSVNWYGVAMRAMIRSQKALNKIEAIKDPNLTEDDKNEEEGE